MITNTQTEPRALSLTSIYWFTNDLRIDDNQTLTQAAKYSKHLICVYIVDPTWFKPNRYGQKSIGQHRWQFLHQTLMDLQSCLKALGQDLLILFDDPLDALGKLISIYNADAVFRSINAGYNENHMWQTLQQRHQQVHFEQHTTHTIFTETALPFSLSDFPSTFTKFRKLLEPLAFAPTPPALTNLPPHPPHGALWASSSLPPVGSTKKVAKNNFCGGASNGLQHLHTYFSSGHGSVYKQVRNELDGWENSTKFSPWLANGSISVKQILRAVQDYENQVEKNESTYWIQFELLWREYFQWLAHAHQGKLFAARGIKQQKVLNTFYPERFQRWCHGNTPCALVNACMNQLNETGYMANRGRQVVASYFVNDLSLDWRYGAAYFEEQLVDYDVAINWGNWQYLAGVGTDPRGKRYFDMEKQTALYDPAKVFITTWGGNHHDATLDSVDAADWPTTNKPQIG